MVKVRYRRLLNNEQLEVLKLLYGYRFGTASDLTEYFGKSSIKIVQKKLKILEDQGYVAKRYDKSYKLQGRPAEYYLTPEGGRRLKAKDKTDYLSEQGLKNLYKNPSVSDDFIAHCLNILKVALHLQKLYGDKLDVLSRTEVIAYDYLPNWKPDLYVNYRSGAKGKPKVYFLDIWDGTRPFFVSVRKARSFITYAEQGDWISDELAFPVILMLCDNQRNETKLRRQIRKALEESYEEVRFATATIDKLLSGSQTADTVWLMVGEDREHDRPRSLRRLWI